MICPECGANTKSATTRCEWCQAVLGPKTASIRVASTMSVVLYGLGLVLLWFGVLLMVGAVYGLVQEISVKSLFLFPIPIVMIIGGYALWQNNKK